MPENTEQNKAPKFRRISLGILGRCSSTHSGPLLFGSAPSIGRRTLYLPEKVSFSEQMLLSLAFLPNITSR